MKEKEFTHLTKDGIHMVEVGDKPLQRRMAIATGKIHLQKSTIKMIENAEIKKGNVLTTAQVAGINAIKNTSNLIPLCHPLSISGIEINFNIEDSEISTTVSVKTTGQTGVEMEAITGVSVVLLTIWDMVKAVEKDENGQYPNTKISDICVLKKEKI
ncbi:MAG: cyclic pyranopterin monophosphate synthase MoaC [Methanobacteriaceae archaeon]|jgi:cyclic pyranopterin phosphate synthase|uniref:cyclic pyranopterin monophosphate synthase MoaC n=1 Tax=unclassified Methanobrevibacter TaxID=2638681 RepID=UPI0037678620|nr:cyclic pyranopterin monophosphate synthase MoaC [Methanobacteriaceae archaeon]MDD4594959.1 cyclic pyranopterin monophosphate synthase MoaC [Methanobacteriaceae archaeon]